ncbi:MAG TPA: DUF262 domain-containing protein, partial [Firmicutes bacterium]|nr:DUF262 domain-containing protein [Bacillota bacterium]
REYKWERKQVAELIEDLTGKFLENYGVSDERVDVAGYNYYFMGAIVISRKDGSNFIIDGQQRLTTLTLLLIYLHKQQGSRADRVKLDDLIFSETYGRKSFNIDVEERVPAMDALYHGREFDYTGQSESVQNIIERYKDVEDLFPEDIDERALPYFADWLKEKVYLVEITAYSDEEAYTIFETMNDRGLSLGQLDMLKGYILVNIADEQKRLRASNTWKNQVAELRVLGKDEGADAFKAWLRSQYAMTIRERRKGAKPLDFDRLGTEFHRWVRDNRDLVGLDSSEDFIRFVEQDMSFYTRQYLRLRLASQSYQPELEAVYYNGHQGFTLQFPLLLSPIRPTDDGDTVLRKLRVTARYIDILLTRRLWNFRSIAYSTMQYAMFTVMREIRGKELAELVDILSRRLENDKEDFRENDRLRLHQQNRRAIRYILARITDHIERRSGLPARFTEYVAEGRNRYEIEHIWANNYERHREEFDHEADFIEYRNRIGGLLLLPKSFNASYGDLPYEDKLDHYYGQNLLAKSLHAKCYNHNPGFLNYSARNGLEFRPHSQFKREDLDARQRLYQSLAEEIWHPSLLHREAQG